PDRARRAGRHHARQPVDPQDRQGARDPLLDARGDLRRAALPAGRPARVLAGQRRGGGGMTAPAAPEELSLLRLSVMRAIYFLIAFAEGSQVVPALFDHDPTARGVIPALLSGL